MTDPTATPDMEARYEIQTRELQRERAGLTKMQAERDAARNLSGRVIEDTARALHCAPDNEVILQEIAALRRALGLANA